MKKIGLIILFGLQLTLIKAQTIPFQRASTLGKGMALSWLERYWLGDPDRNFADYFDVGKLVSRKSELLVMKQMGIKTLRLPVWFSGWYSTSSSNPSLLTPQYFVAVDSFVRWTNELGMNIILDYHQGNLTNQNKATEVARIANIWKKVAARYANASPNRVFFEVYNEPYDINSADWKSAANRIVDSIRTVAPNHTLIVGGTNFNNINYLDSLGTLKDNNIIYTFHFYEPFIFTHQGAIWVDSGIPVATKRIPFPYNSATMPPIDEKVRNTWGESSYYDYPRVGTNEMIINQLQVAYQWQTRNQRPVYCGEFGSDAIYADADSRCRLLKTIRQTLDTWKMPFSWWDWDGGFKMFNGNTPSVSALPTCFLDAWGITTTPSNGSQNDISLELTADVAAYKPFSTLKYIISAKNNSATAFNNVKIEFVFPTDMKNGGAAITSVGKWSEWCIGNTKCYTWTIPVLAANATAKLTLPLYNLNNGQPIVATAKLLSSTPTDAQTQNNQATLILNKINSTALVSQKPTQLVPIVIQSLAPTVTEGDIKLQLESLLDTEQSFSIYNAMGKVVKTWTQKVVKGNSWQNIDVWDLSQGMYILSIDGIQRKNVAAKFVKM